MSQNLFIFFDTIRKEMLDSLRKVILFFLLEIYLQNILWEKSFLAVLFSMRGHFHLLFY